MAGLFGGGGGVKTIPEFTGIQINTSVQVLPIPIIYGCPRVSINLIYYNQFVAATTSSSSGSGKGILSGGKGGSNTKDQVTYYATIIAGISEGPIGSPIIIYQDQEVWTPDTYPIPSGSAYYNGTADQTPWPYVEDNWPPDARPYKNTAYWAFPEAVLDSSGTMPQIDLVVEGFLFGTSQLNNSTISITTGQYDQNGNPLSFIGDIGLGCCDADPGMVIYDFLTNSQYGAGFPAQYIDTSTLFTGANGYISTVGDAAISTFCQAVGLAWSFVLNNAQSASSILERLCKNLNVAVVWNGALLRFIPYWDQFSGDNPGLYTDGGAAPKYFAPFTTPIVTITLDQILQSKEKTEDPITFSRKDPWDVYNTVRLDFSDRTNFYNANPVEVKDEALIELYGPRVDNIGQADEFTLQDYANVSAQMQLRRQASIRRNFTWMMGPLWGWLDPMDILLIPDPTNYANTVLVRVVSVEDDEDENVTITAEEFPIGSQSPSIIPMSPTTPPNQGAVNNPPSSIYPPVMFSVPAAMLTVQGVGVPSWIFGCSASYDGTFDKNWGGANIWVSLDNISYQQLGTLTGPSTIGTLSEAVAGYGGVNPDNVDSIVVNLNECDGVLASVTASAAAMGSSICVLQDSSGIEIIGYTTATLTGDYTYTLTGLYRGLYGTTPRFFGAGSQFMAVSSGQNFFETPIQTAYIGQTFYVKAQSFNVFNNATQDLTDCVAYRFTLTGSTPLPPTPPISAQPPIAAKLRRKALVPDKTIANTRKKPRRT
jgi:hypothetical protein